MITMKISDWLRTAAHTKLKLKGSPRVDTAATGSLKGMKLKAKNKGDLQSAVLSAGYYAKKQNKTMYVYPGNSYGHGIWRVTYKPGEYLDPVNNTGTKVLLVTPELQVLWQDIER